jgi:uncharacterized protein YggU (UPF0235/DUF167 family)
MKISVTVHPNSKNPRIEKDIFDNLHIYVHEPPLEGKANHAVRIALTNHFHTKKSNVFLVSGEKSKIKVFEVLNQ